MAATVFNGLFVENDEGAYKAFPAAGGNLQKHPGFTKKNSKDFQLFVNQILRDDGSGVSLYASYHPIPKLDVQAAYQSGKDHLFNPAAANADGTFKSKGWFGEVDVPAADKLTLGLRYDWFDASDKKDHNNRTGVTAYANVPFNDGWQVITQYRRIAQQRASLDDLKDDNFQVRLIWIW